MCRIRQKKECSFWNILYLHQSVCQSNSYSGCVFPHRTRNHADCRSINMKQYVDNFYHFLSSICNSKLSFFAFPFYSHELVKGSQSLDLQPCSSTFNRIKDDIRFTLFRISHNVLLKRSTDAEECDGLWWKIFHE